jgi:toxin ParE1/3/4
MERLDFSPQALRELQSIWDYSAARWSEEQADKYTNKIRAVCQKIAFNPLFGRRYTGMPNWLLGYKAESHVIFYTVISPEQILIVRILHGSMDFKKQFKNRR